VPPWDFWAIAYQFPLLMVCTCQLMLKAFSPRFASHNPFSRPHECRETPHPPRLAADGP
jgi:hypothetical protein